MFVHYDGSYLYKNLSFHNDETELKKDASKKQVLHDHDYAGLELDDIDLGPESYYSNYAFEKDLETQTCVEVEFCKPEEELHAGVELEKCSSQEDDLKTCLEMNIVEAPEDELKTCLEMELSKAPKTIIHAEIYEESPQELVLEKVSQEVNGEASQKLVHEIVKSPELEETGKRNCLKVNIVLDGVPTRGPIQQPILDFNGAMDSSNGREYLKFF